MVICKFVGYFTLVLYALLSLVLYDLLHIWNFWILSLCYAIPFPLLLYQNTSLPVSLLFLLPAAVHSLMIKSINSYLFNISLFIMDLI
jgi:hypothetical protein